MNCDSFTLRVPCRKGRNEPLMRRTRGWSSEDALWVTDRCGAPGGQRDCSASGLQWLAAAATGPSAEVKEVPALLQVQ